jgi:hypothetical protein
MNYARLFAEAVAESVRDYLLDRQPDRARVQAGPPASARAVGADPHLLGRSDEPSNPENKRPLSTEAVWERTRATKLFSRFKLSQS